MRLTTALLHLRFLHMVQAQGLSHHCGVLPGSRFWNHSARISGSWRRGHQLGPDSSGRLRLACAAAVLCRRPALSAAGMLGWAPKPAQIFRRSHFHGTSRDPAEPLDHGAAGYKANLAAAGESDGRLEQRLQQSSSSFSALSLDNAVAAMPRLQVSHRLVPRSLQEQQGRAYMEDVLKLPVVADSVC